MTVQATELLIDKIIVLITYFTIVPIVGCFRAWVAEKMGDDTPEQLGFLTFNPLAHISYFWIIVIGLDWVPFGFGKYIPINPLHFHGKMRNVKMVCAYLSDTVANIVLALLALFAFVLFFGINPATFMFIFSDVRTASAYPEYASISSFGIIMALFLRNIVIFNSLLATFNFVINVFYVGFFALWSKKFDGNTLELAGYAQWIMFLGPILALLFFVRPLEHFILWLIMTIGIWFWQFIQFLS